MRPPPILLAMLLLHARPAPALAEMSLADRTKTTLASVRAELSGLSGKCMAGNDPAMARDALRRALRLQWDDGVVTKLRQMKAWRNAPAPATEKALRTLREETHARCHRLLRDLARACRSAGRDELSETWATYAQRLFPGPTDPKGLVYFGPYLRWVAPADNARLLRGEERVDGAWLTSKQVAARNREHRRWSRPWSLSDGVMNIKTTMPLRTARQLAAHVSWFRRFFLAEFIDEWDLRPPKGELDVIVTATHAELKALMKQAAPGAREYGPSGAAFYIATNRALNPCLVTFQPKQADDTLAQINFEQLAFTLRHELTHQIAFEYSKHAAHRNRLPRHHFWAVEGLAEFACNFVPTPNGHRLSHHRSTPGPGGANMPGNFAWTHRNLSRVLALREFLATPREEFPTIANYHTAATATYFLLTADRGRYRARLCRLLEQLHQAREDRRSFAVLFDDLDWDRLQQEWLAFVMALKIDD